MKQIDIVLSSSQKRKSQVRNDWEGIKRTSLCHCINSWFVYTLSAVLVSVSQKGCTRIRKGSERDDQMYGTVLYEQ